VHGERRAGCVGQRLDTLQARRAVGRTRPPSKVLVKGLGLLRPGPFSSPKSFRTLTLLGSHL
jgi:hypothetical protein